ncbi:hypothetical protein GCM10010270_83740 [Streptomyces violaceus]|nr:hypothetical protein GCM10010270_83740 [Streptomyces janthinus]
MRTLVEVRDKAYLTVAGGAVSVPASPRRRVLLRCPTCRTRHLDPDRGALRCPVGHSFDIARHGCASLLTGTRATSGDDAAMVQAP